MQVSPTVAVWRRTSITSFTLVLRQRRKRAHPRLCSLPVLQLELSLSLVSVQPSHTPVPLPFATSIEVRPTMDVDSSSPTAYLETLLTQTPSSLHPAIEQLINYSQRKLYHQLSNALQSFLKLPESAPFQIGLWSGFISKVVKKLDQLRAVEMAVTVAQQYERER